MRRLRREVPAAVRALDVGRRLAWGLTQDGTAIVATSDALHVADESLAWHEVEKAVWRPPYLVVTRASEVEGSGRTLTLALAEDDQLAETVRARVTSSVGWSDRRRLVPSGHVRLVGRRLPGQDRLRWQAVFADAADALDPAKRDQAEQLLAELRRTIG